jgi:hypothetical protein
VVIREHLPLTIWLLRVAVVVDNLHLAVVVVRAACAAQ